MGLYSNNRVAGIVAEAAKTPEQDLSLESFIKEIEETAFDPTFGHVLEAAILLHENDKRMFDTLIECDFISVTNEAVLLEEEAAEANGKANESKFAKIGEKIHTIFENIMNWIKKAAANVIYKITDIVKADKKLVETYKPVLTLDNLKEFPGIRDFAFPKAMVDKESLKSVENAKGFATSFTQTIKSAEERDVVDTAFKEFEEAINKEVESFKNMTKDETYFGAKEELWKPTEDWQIKKMINSVTSASDTIKEIKTHSATVLKALKQLQSEAKSALIHGKNKKAAGEVEVYKMNTLYQVASKTCNMFTKEFNAYTHLAAKQIAACRKATILCGRYALKASKGVKVEEEKVAEESAIMNALGESSDMYVFECFA